LRNILIAFLLISICQVPASAGELSDKAACEKVKKQIRLVQDKMRAGYSAAQGIRYDARLRELREKRYRVCRR